MQVYFSPQCLTYSQMGHPESPLRVRATYEYLKEKKCTFIEPESCCENDILRVHSTSLLEGVKRRGLFDSDTPALPNIFGHALLSAGSAVLASEASINGEVVFSLMRPPGHHATRDRIMGFCYFNNIAIAVAKYVDVHPGQRAAILDIDCHHGNGTEDIFLDCPGVLYVSLHQSPLYPGSGLTSRKNCHNFPLLPGTEEKVYLETLKEACGIIVEFSPSLLGISAGFDTYRGDPLTQFGLEVGTYREIGKLIAELKIPTFGVMEGGYSRDLPQCVFAFLRGLAS